jgi:hypothetical protein
MCDAGMQDREDQIVENRLRGKELAGPGQDEGGIFTEGDLEVHRERLSEVFLISNVLGQTDWPT